MDIFRRIFTPSKEITMKTTRRFLLAAISMALALTFLACGGGGGGGGYDDTDSSSSVVGGAGSSSSITGGSSSSSPYLQCGAEFFPYDTRTHFCFEGASYEKCGGEDYNPTTQGCVSNKVLTRCGTSGMYYDPSIPQLCQNNEVYELCGGTNWNTNGYNIETQTCQNGVITAKCGPYDQATEACCGS
jgi:hypothetical protein